MPETVPKYLNTAESPAVLQAPQLYGLHLAKEQAARTGRIVVVEGYMDVVGLYRHGSGAGGFPGHGVHGGPARLLKRFAGEVVLAYDADAAGQAATLRGMEILAGRARRARWRAPPEGHDPDSLVRERGLDAFRQVLDESLPLVEYQMEEVCGVPISAGWRAGWRRWGACCRSWPGLRAPSGREGTSPSWRRGSVYPGRRWRSRSRRIRRERDRGPSAGVGAPA